jgi:hypothetical protein
MLWAALVPPPRPAQPSMAWARDPQSRERHVVGHAGSGSPVPSRRTLPPRPIRLRRIGARLPSGRSVPASLRHPAYARCQGRLAWQGRPRAVHCRKVAAGLRSAETGLHVDPFSAEQSPAATFDPFSAEQSPAATFDPFSAEQSPAATRKIRLSERRAPETRPSTAARRYGRRPGPKARGPPRLQGAGMPLQPYQKLASQPVSTSPTMCRWSWSM